MEDASKYYAVTTDTGNRLMAAALAEGKKLSLSHIAVGDGGGDYYRPAQDMTKLKNEVWRGEINSCEISSEADNVLIVKGIIPGDIGGFTIREMGIFTAEGEMIAVSNTPATPKVKIVDGVINEMSVAIEITLVNKNIVKLMVDPTIVTATKKDIEAIWDQIRSNGKVMIGPADTPIGPNDICLIQSDAPATFQTAIINNLPIGVSPPEEVDVFGRVEGKLTVGTEPKQDTVFYGGTDTGEGMDNGR